MGYIDSIKSALFGDEPDDREFVDYPVKQSSNQQRSTNRTTNSHGNANSGNLGSSKVIDMAVSTNIKMATFRPLSYNDSGECREIAESLREKRCVILNLEVIEKRDRLRLLDFLAGFCYAQNNVVQKISMDVYFLGPYNVDFIGGGDELMSIIEENHPW